MVDLLHMGIKSLFKYYVLARTKKNALMAQILLVKKKIKKIKRKMIREMCIAYIVVRGYLLYLCFVVNIDEKKL